ncbi:MAG: cytochrome c oxidase assembly protein, partial [Intrasporangium sp.]|uniref:cytochrome c oxidase assembly protein n=1 Tax=Intrasporangium sp. TaxID=1925024 RepID=UPI0026478E1E
MSFLPPVRAGGTRRWVFVPLVVLLGLLASALAAAFTGAAAPLEAGLSTAGAGVRWALPLLRVVHDVAAALTVGSLLLGAMLMPGEDRRVTEGLDEPRRAVAYRVAALSGFTWAIAALGVVILQFADLAGMPLSSPGFGASFTATAWAIEPLRIGLITAGCAAVAGTGAALARSRWTGIWLLAVALFGVLVLGLAGHAGGSADHETAVNAIAAHIVSAAVWVGGLLALVLLRRTAGRSLGVVVRRYSVVALWCFVALGVSGVMAASTRLDSVAELVTTRYGVLISIKIAAFVLLGLAGWRHRGSTIDRIDDAVSAGDPTGRPFLRLAVSEVLLMGATFGVATALARSAPPVPEVVPNPSAVLALSGFPAPATPSALSWLTAWRVEYLFLATALLAIGLYLAGVLRLHRRGVRWPVGRTVGWVVGWLLFIWATNGFLGVYGRVAFSWHMTLHMLEAMVIPIFLVLGAPVTLALRTLKPRKDGTVGPRELILAVIHSRYMRVVGNPVFAGAFFFMSLVVFYWTGLFYLALTTHTGHLLMTLHFVLAGYFFAWVLIGVDPGPKKWRPALRLLVLFATISFHAFFGIAIVGGTSVLAPDFFTTIDIPWITDPLVDQRLGGSIAWAIGELPSLMLALIVALQWVRLDRAEMRRTDRQADRDNDAALAAYNAHLAALARYDEAHRA